LEPAKRLEDLVAKCDECDFVDKPFIKYQVYTRWLPDQVKVLAIGESPPPGFKNSLFYNLESFDRFRLSMKLILGVKDDLGILELLRSKNIFITAAVKCRPVNRFKISDMRKKCEHILKMEIELLKPEKIIAMGKTAALTISRILGVRMPESVNGIFVNRKDFELYFVPHPNYVFRFKRNVAFRIKSLFLM